MAEEIFLLSAIANAIENQQREEALEKDSVNWTVMCPDPCCTQLVRVKGYRCYNATPNSTIQCNGCGENVSAKNWLFHCPKERYLLHLSGFDYCLDCAYKKRGANNNANVSVLQSQIVNQTKTIDDLKQNMDQSERHLSEQIRQLKREKDDLLARNAELSTKANRLTEDKLDIQRECRSLKQKLEDKLDIIAQNKEDINRLKTRPQTTQKGDELSPTLKAMFTQKFFEDDFTKNMPKSKLITALHNEILGVTFASHQTLCWMQKNCRKYDAQNDDEVFSFSNYQNRYGMNDDHKANNVDNCKGDKPLVDLNGFERNTVQKLDKMLKMLQSKYEECVQSTKEWSNTIDDVLHPGSSKAVGKKKNAKDWKNWTSQQVVTWILGLDNGRFVRYAFLLQNADLNGPKLASLEHTDLFEMGVNIVNDQKVLLVHIKALTNAKTQKDKVSAAYADEGNNTSTLI
eukprot:41033_1